MIVDNTSMSEFEELGGPQPWWMPNWLNRIEMMPPASLIDWAEWHRDHADLPIVLLCCYLTFIFGVPVLMEKRNAFPLKKAFAVWNLLLSFFSIRGAVVLVPHLYRHVVEKGFNYTVCANPEVWHGLHPRVGAWVMIFIYSKLPELLDTVFLVLRKKPVIFLHWFHHITVLAYCWHAYHVRMACGIWFAAMNFTVHSVMYFYYFMMNMGFYKLMKPAAPVITVLQISQMIGGMAVLFVARGRFNEFGFGGPEPQTERHENFHSSVGNRTTAWVPILKQYHPEGCWVDRSNISLGLCMYFSYWVLFCVLFWGKYCGSNKPLKKGQRPPHDATVGCVDDVKNVDATGFFQPDCDSLNGSKPKAE